MSYNAGTAYLQVVPSFRDIERELSRLSRRLGEQIGKHFDGTLSPELAAAARRAANEGRADFAQAGRTVSGAFVDAFRKRTEAAFKALPNVQLDADSTEVDKAVHALRRELAELHDQRIGIDITEAEAIARLRRLQQQLKQLTDGNHSVELTADTDVARAQVARFFDDVKTEQARAADRIRLDADKTGRTAGGTFGDAFRKRIEGAFKALPHIQLDADSTDADKAVQAIRVELAKLHDQRIGIDITEAEAIVRLRRVQQQLKQLTDGNHSVELTADTDVARAQVARFFDDVKTEQARAADRSRLDADKTGLTAGGTFGDAFRTRIEGAFKALPHIQLDADSSDVDKAVQAIRVELAKLHDQRIGIDITEAEAIVRLRRVQQQLKQLTDGNYSVELTADTDVARAQVARFFDEVKTEQARAADAAAAQAARAAQRAADRSRLDADKAGMTAGGTFGDAFRTRIEAAFKALPHIQLDADSSDVDKAVQAIRTELAKLHDQRIGIDITEAEAIVRLRRLQQQLKQLTDGNHSVELTADTDRARAQLAEFSKDIQTAQSKAADAAYKKAVQDAERAANAAHRAAQRVGLQQSKDGRRAAQLAADAAARDAQRAAQKTADAYARTFSGQLQQTLQRAVQRLPDVQVGANTSDADKALAQIRAELVRLSTARIGIDIDEAEALLQIAALRERLNELSHADPNVKFRFDAAAGAAELAAISTMTSRLDGDDVNVDVDVDTGRGIAGLTSLSDATRVNLSYLATLVALGSSIGTAIVPAAAAATAAIGFIGTAAAASVVGVGVLALGFSGVSDAVTALGQQADEAASSQASLSRATSQVATATDAVSSAQRQLGFVREQNADAERRAAREVEQAEISLASAQLTERRAQAELTQAREDARRALEDMALAVEDNALRQRQATLDVAAAKEQLDTLLANPRATEQEREQAQVTYEQALLQQEQLGIQAQRLAADQQAAAKKGVDGSDQVTAAQDRIADATARVAEQQRRLADAVLAQTSQQRQAANALTSAQQQAVAAQRSLQGAYASAGVAGGASIDNVRTAMATLSPVGQEFAGFVFGLRDELFEVRAAAADGLLSGMQDAIEQVLPYLPPLIRFVGEVSDELGDLAGRALQELNDPTWQRLFAYLEQTAVPTIEHLFTVGANLAEGMTGLFLAFTPLTGDVADGILRVSQRFADWATSLDRNPAFQNFLTYVRDAAPEVLDLLTQFGLLVLHIAEAAAPTGMLVVEIFTQLFEWINKVPIDVLEVLVGAVAGIAAGLTALAVVTAAISLGWAGAIVAGIAAIAAGVTILYETVQPFRAFVDQTWQAIAAGAVWLWQQILMPAFAGIAAAATWLWTNGIYPLSQIFATQFAVIGHAVGFFWTTIGQPVFNQIHWAVTKVIAPVLGWLYEAVVKPTFEAIGVVFNVAGAAFQVMSGVFQIGTKILAAAFMFIWDAGVRPVWDKISPFFDWLRDVIAVHVVPPFKKGLAALATAFGLLVDAAKTPIKFVIETVLNDGLLHGYNTLAKAFGVKPDDVRISLPSSWDDKLPAVKFADGGVLPGYTPGRDVHRFSSPTGGLLDLSGGEAILRPEGTTALGSAWVDGVNRAARTGGVGAVERFLSTHPGSGGGRGESGDGLGDLLDAARDKAGDVLSGITSVFTDPVGTLRSLAEDLIALVPGADTMIGSAVVAVPERLAEVLGEVVKRLFTGDDGATGFGVGGIGSAAMMNILHGPFPGLRMISGYRAGAITVTGNPSYHGMIAANGEKGRAVDVPPGMAVFNWLHDQYPDSRELIYTPAAGRQIHNGQPHVYSGAVAADHHDHLHWALRNGGILPTLYDQGGYLPPGLSVVANGTGRPEPVFTDAQWRQLQSRDRGESSGGNQYTFHFADSTLTPARLRALQDREDARNRAHRPR